MSFRPWIPAALLVAAAALSPRIDLASDPPHDSANVTNGCNDCHIAHGAAGATLTKVSGNANLCLTCHTSKSPTYINSWASADQAVPGTSGSSHNWSNTATNATYGAALPTNTTMLQGLKAGGGSALSCSACHDQHTQLATPVDPLASQTADTAGRHFQRISNTNNEMCLDCHASWKVTSVLSGTYTGSNLSHPVTVALATGSTTFRAAPADTAFMGTATGGTTTTLTLDGTKYKWATNALANYVVRFTSGANKNVVAVVTANSTLTASPYTTTLTFGAVGTAVAAGTTFQLARVSALGSDVATAAGTTTTIADSTKSWAASTLAYSVTMLSGTSGNIGKTAAVSSISGTTITLSAALPAATAANDVYRINWKTDNVGAATAAGTTTTLTDSTKGWTASALVNFTLRMTSGTNSGTTTKITANTATGLTFTALASAVAAGDTYEIYPAQGAAVAGAITASPTTTSFTDGNRSWTASALVGQMVRFTSGTYAGYVSTITANTATGLTFTALPAAPAIGNTYEVDWDGNTTNNVVLGGTPSSFTAGNVVCSSCHGVHFADGDSSTYDGKPQTGNGLLLRRENDDRACLGCHAVQSHNSANTSSKRAGWGQSFGCRTCHQPHQTKNIYVFAPSLVTPNSGTVTVDFRTMVSGEEANGLVNGTTTPSAGTGPCEACHTDTRNGNQVTGTTSTFTASSTAVTLDSSAGLAAGWEIKLTAGAASAWTRIATVVNGTSVTLITGGYRGTTGTGTWQAANPRFRTASAGRGGTGSGRGAAGTEHYVSKCTGCHSHANGFSAAGGESTGGTACDACHGDTFNRMNASVTTNPSGATILTRHTLGSAAANGAASDSGITWGSPLNGNAATARSCVNMCHSDHPHNVSPGTTHDYNGYLDATSSGSRGFAAASSTSNRDRTDFEAGQANFGMCVSCHRNPVDSSAPVQHPAINGTSFAASAHNYTSNTVGASTYSWTYTLDYGTFGRNCTKCHSDRGDARPNAAGIPMGGVHYSAYPSLLSGNVNPAKSGNVAAEYACWNCHGNGTTGANLSGKNIVNDTSLVFAHPVSSDSVHNTITEATATAGGTLYQGTNRHANCLDCHNPHLAKPVGTTGATGTSGTVTFTAGTDPAPDTLTDATKTWTVNQWKGYLVKIVSATAGTGQLSVIYKNTATQLLVKFATAPTGTIQYVILPTGTASGNMASGPLTGAPVAGPSGGTWPAQPAAPTWDDYNTKAGTADAAPFANGGARLGGNVWTAITWTTSVATPVEGNLCIRCHSSFAFGTTLPSTPSGAPGTSWTAKSATVMLQGDKANEFNPKNLSHHAVFAPGNNQPIVSGAASYYNPNWPKFINNGTTTATINVTTTACSTAPCSVTLNNSTWPVSVLPGWFINIGSSAPAAGATTWYKVVGVPSDTVLQVDRATTAGANQAFILTAGLGSNFIPPFGPWSTLACSDCHQSNAASDPFGPHGSSYKYLTSGTRTIKFLQYQGTASTNTVTAVTSTPADSYDLCINCHWRETYGDNNYSAPTKANWSRVPHPVDGRGDMYVTAFAGNGSKWGIACMTCHGGARSGGIHGQNVGIGNNGGTGAPASQSGKRMLAGSNWYAVTRPTTTSGSGHCWTKPAADSVDTCTHNHIDQTQGFQTATYNYDAP